MSEKKANKLFNVFLIALAFCATLVFIALGGYFQSGYKIEVGGVSPARFKAPRETINEMATAKEQQKAADSVSMIYKMDETATAAVMDKLDAVFDALSEERRQGAPLYTPYNTTESPKDTKTLTELGVSLSIEQLYNVVNMDSETFTSFRGSLEAVIGYQLEIGVRPDGIQRALTELKSDINSSGMESIEKLIAVNIATAVMQPNSLPDEEATNEARRAKVEAVEPIVISAGQKIVDKDEIITEEIYHILDSLGYTSRNLYESIVSVAGTAVLCLIVFTAALLYVYFYYPVISTNRKTALLLFTFYLADIVAAWAMRALPYQFTPILLFTMLISILIDTRLSLVMSFLMTIICAVIVHGDVDFIMYFIILGIFSSVFSNFTTERSRVFSISIVLSVVGAVTVVSLAFLLESSVDYNDMANQVIYSVLNGILAVTLCIGSLPVWEALFGIVTKIKLMDLANPSNPLLRRLIIEAPGTYHHSLIVANLAETAAYDIGSNPLLAKVGGYYHDIGKLKFPDYFGENIVGENPHDSLSPEESATVIKEHVTYGLELAGEYKLPKAISDFISEHHGTTLIKYFYHKAKSADPEAEVDEEKFRYHFNPPHSRESAVVMLADTVEAAVRSMIPSGKSMKEVEIFVRALVKDKLEDGQLTYSGLTITDLETVTGSFMKVFKGLYHERIPYPKTEKKV